ncbi:MAG: general stress protein [Novosphingobium sp.]
MVEENVVVAIFSSHAKAEEAVRTLGRSGLSMDHLTIVGKGYHTDEKVIGFYNLGDRIKLWGSNGAFWGSLWGLFAGGMLMTVPLVGPVVVLGHLAAMIVGAVEGAVLVGGVSALAGALASLGIPNDSVVRYEEAVKADQYVVMAHGSAAQIDDAKRVLEAAAPVELTVHEGTSAGSAGHAAHHHQSELMAS